MVDISKAAEEFDGKAALCGNFDPVSVMLQGSPEDVFHAVLFCQENGGSCYISSAGCEIPDRTPVDNLLAQSKALKGSGKNRFI
jgi:uroporphyrinogen decarboxylase